MPKADKALVEAGGHDQGLSHRLDKRTVQSSGRNPSSESRLAAAPGQAQRRIVRLAEGPRQKPPLPGVQLQLLSSFTALADNEAFKILI